MKIFCLQISHGICVIYGSLISFFIITCLDMADIRNCHHPDVEERNKEQQSENARNLNSDEKSPIYENIHLFLAPLPLRDNYLDSKGFYFFWLQFSSSS